jgi:hypothetical protein
VKDPEHRYQTAKDLRNELEELKQEEGVAPRKRAGVLTWVLLGAAALLVVAGAIYWLRPSTSSSLKTTFTQLTAAAVVESFPSLSPDGNSLVYVKDGDIYLQRVGGRNAST